VSIFIKAERFGFTPRFFKSRLKSICLGEDRSGLLVLEAAASSGSRTPEVVFPLFIIDQRLLKVLMTRTLIEGKIVHPGQFFDLNSCTRLTCHDYELTLCLISEISDYLSLLEGLSPEELLSHQNFSTYPQLEVASLKAALPLVPQCHISVGSDSQCPVWIDLPAVRPEHCALYFDHSTISVVSIQGSAYFERSRKAAVSIQALPETLILGPDGPAITIFSPGSA
jgi:hypothetical protein